MACSLTIYFFNTSHQMDLFRGFQTNVDVDEEAGAEAMLVIVDPEVNTVTGADSESTPDPRVGLVDLPDEILLSS